MITTENKMNLLERISKIEQMNICSVEVAKKASNISGTPSDKVLDNYPNNGKVKLDNCYVCLSNNSIILRECVQFYSESFTYRDSSDVSERFIGYNNSSIYIIGNNMNVVSSIKMWFYVKQTILKQKILLIGLENGLTDFDAIVSKNMNVTGFSDSFFSDNIVISWPVFKKLCEEIMTDEQWTLWFNTISTNLKNGLEV